MKQVTTLLSQLSHRAILSSRFLTVRLNQEGPTFPYRYDTVACYTTGPNTLHFWIFQVARLIIVIHRKCSVKEW